MQKKAQNKLANQNPYTPNYAQFVSGRVTSVKILIKAQTPFKNVLIMHKKLVNVKLANQNRFKPNYAQIEVIK